MGEHDWTCTKCGTVVEQPLPDDRRMLDLCPNCTNNRWEPSRHFKAEMLRQEKRLAERRADARKIVPTEPGLYWYWDGKEWTVVDVQEDQSGCVLWYEWAREPEDLVESGAFGPKLVPPSVPPGEE